MKNKTDLANGVVIMQVNIQEYIESCGLEEPFYPGKRVVKKLPQPGEYKSHCMVFDWRDPDKIRIEVKAGLSGRDLPPKELAKYPPSFQAPTFMEIAVGQTKAQTQNTKKQKGACA